MGAALTVARVSAACAAALISLLIGFAALSVQDTQAMATVRSALVITGADEATPVVRMLRDEAELRDANFYRVRMDPTGPVPTRTLAPIIGDRELHDRAFPSGEYASFDTATSTKLAPMTGGPRGAYLSTLPPKALQKVATRLAGAGVEAQVQSVGWGTLLRYMVGYTPTVMAAVVGLCAAWLAGFV